MNVSRLQELVDIAFFKGQATLLYLQAWQESYITKGCVSKEIAVVAKKKEKNNSIISLKTKPIDGSPVIKE